MDAIGLILLLLFARVQVPRRQLLAAAALTVITSLAITGVRVHQGRNLFYSDSGIRARVSALIGGLSAASGAQAGEGFSGPVRPGVRPASPGGVSAGLPHILTQGAPPRWR